MRPHPRAAVAVLFALGLLPCSLALGRGARAPASKPAVAAPAPPPTARFPWPGGTREALELPPQAWADVLKQGQLPARPLGYTTEEMKNFGRDHLVMRPVENLFRDARGTLRFSGRITDEMLAAADPTKPSLAELTRLSYVLTDVAAGRMFPAPTAGTWGAEWLKPESTPLDALLAALKRCAPKGPAGKRKPSRSELAALPPAVQRALARCLIGADMAAPWLDLAFDGLALPKPSGNAAKDQDALLALASAPWTDETNDQTATLSKLTFTLLEDVDRDYLAYGSVIALLHVGLAAEELRAWSATDDGRAALAQVSTLSIELPTRFGVVRVSGSGSDAHEPTSFLALDLGGDDRWTGRHGVPATATSRVAFAIDLGGNDTWEGGAKGAALGCGLFGVGAVLDLGGNDSWRVEESGLGAAWFGTGILLDASGDDRYVVKDGWAQGAAHAGVGILLDLAGNDSYECAQQSQGLGSTLGTGLLLDVAGNDRYVARDDGNIEEIYLNQSVAMAQGCGYGRRADLGDGHSLAGGFGVLIDGAGDDFYHAQVWSQGAAYWWSCGILEDRGGNDTYENGKYSLGAGAHFAIGVMVDLMGDDKYNVGIESAKNQYHGHARDGSMGIAVDGDGSDHYFLRSHCAGSADLDSIALFWDRRGDDRYDVAVKDTEPANGWNEIGPMGTATWYTPYRSFRDDLPTTGIFLDTGGTDTHSEGSPGQLRRIWTQHHAPASYGVAMDAEWYGRP